jgi:hypothetical protein
VTAGVDETKLVADRLDGQAASGLIGYDPAADTYHLSAEAAETPVNIVLEARP